MITPYGDAVFYLVATHTAGTVRTTLTWPYVPADVIYSSKSKQERSLTFGRTVPSATATCAGCTLYPFRDAASVNVLSSIKSPEEDASPSQ